MSAGIPGHVPGCLVFDFDRFDAPQLKSCPHRNVAELFRRAPEIFFTPHDGGHWVVRRASLALDMLRQPELFSSDPKYNVANRRNPRTLPNQADPPEHTALRRIVNGYFSPAGVKRIEGDIRASAISLVEAVAGHGRCEFVAEIAKRFSVELFLRMAGAPLEDREWLIAMSERFTRSPERRDRLSALEQLAGYLQGLVRQREAAPGSDLISVVVDGRVAERPLDDDEKLGMVTLLFLGGLDTVVAMLSFIVAFLGRHPSHYAQLVENPRLLPRAVEELMRVHGVAGTERGVTRDLEYAGVQFKMGDRLVFMPHIYGLDDELVSRPFEIDFDRPASGHFVFGAGPHRCLGSNLARVEIRVFLEEWIRRIPRYAVNAVGELETCGGLVWTPTAVPLAWDSTSAGASP